MKIFFEIQKNLLDNNFTQVREIFNIIDFEEKLVGIVWPRWVWKTTILIKYLWLNNLSNSLYISADNIYFLENKLFDFALRFKNEAVLWSKILKWSFINWYKNILIDYIWQIYYTWKNKNNNKITKTISQDRFRKNTIWNERVLEIIWDDLLKFWFKKSYSDYLFRTWINWILFWEKKKGLDYLKKSLKYNFDLKIFIIFILSILSKKIVLTIYKLYI